MSDMVDVVEEAVQRTEERVRALEARIKDLHADIEAFVRRTSSSADQRGIDDTRKQLGI